MSGRASPAANSPPGTSFLSRMRNSERAHPLPQVPRLGCAVQVVCGKSGSPCSMSALSGHRRPGGRPSAREGARFCLPCFANAGHFLLLLCQRVLFSAPRRVLFSEPHIFQRCAYFFPEQRRICAPFILTVDWLG